MPARFAGLSESERPVPVSRHVHFAYTVQPFDRDTDGVRIGANALRLASGDRIRSDATGADAELDHAALGPQSGHRVDGRTTVDGEPAASVAGAGIRFVDRNGDLLETRADGKHRLWAPEGGSARYGLRLKTRPAKSVVLSFHPLAGDPDLDVPRDFASDRSIAPDEWVARTVWVRVEAAQDADYENGERVFAHNTASNDPNYHHLVLPDVVVVEADDEAGPLALSVVDAQATEGVDATLDFTVRLHGDAASEVTVDYRTEDGTATAGSDYTETSGTLTFALDETAKTVSVPITDDDVEDDGETFTLVLSNASFASSDQETTVTGTIRNTETQAPSFTSDAAFDAAENQTAAGTVRATDGDAGDNIESYAITGGADRALFDVNGTSGALTFQSAPNFEDPKDESANNTYMVEVTATSGAGGQEKTATQTVTVTVTVTVTDVAGEAPGKPDAPEASAASATSLTVSWSAPDNAGPAIDDYDVRYRTGASGDWSDGDHAGDASSATLTGLSENTSWDVQVRATNDEGTGAWSDSGTGRTSANAAAGRVTGVSVTEQVEQLAASWNQAAGASGYKVQWKSGGQDYNEGDRQSIVSGGGATEHTISNLAAGVEYTVRVIATKNNAADGPASAEATGTPLSAGTVAGAPRRLRAVAGDAEAALNWDAPGDDGGADVAGYAWRYKESGGDFIDYTDIPDSGPGEANARSYTVPGLTNGLEYVFHVRAVNEHGAGSPAEAAVTLPTGVSTESEELPTEVTLSANYPNPFNPETTIPYELPKAGQVRLAVYDMLGHEVAVLVDESKPAGNHTVRFGAGDLPSGVYAYRLQAGGETVVRTMLLLK